MLSIYKTSRCLIHVQVGWYKIVLIMNAEAEGQNTMAESSLPKDANTIIAILKDMGVTDYEPRVIHQMLEFAYRYITDVLEDAKTYASHAGRTNISIEDTKLAVQMQLDHHFTGPPPRDFLVDAARQKNTAALPPLKNFAGARLPPDRYCLSSVNYRLRTTVDEKPNRKPTMSNSRSGPLIKNENRTSQKHQFVNPQIIMPNTGGAIKRKWLDEEDYDT
ncbi:unnamed protein product [Clavelina lepadiformis]|uniref:Transcription initiation factor TFIID subunit 9 n=1 Tax=Clavelina lepadiformis TaxID=159417 RepID=A0ABP0GFZ5_CLALP